MVASVNGGGTVLKSHSVNQFVTVPCLMYHKWPWTVLSALIIFLKLKENGDLSAGGLNTGGQISLSCRE